MSIFSRRKASPRIFLQLSLIIASLFVAIILATSSIPHQILESSKELGLASAFFTGVFFASTFTALPASVSLFILGQEYNVVAISLIAALGTALGDLLIPRFIKEDLSKTFELVLSQSSKVHLRKLFTNKMLHLPLIVLASIIIASPLPDELGIAILGMTKFAPKNFFLLSFGLNFLGIITITMLGDLLSD